MAFIDFFKEKKEYLIVFLISVSVVFSGSLIAPIEQRFISFLTKDSVLMGLTFTLGTLSIAIISLAFARFSRKYGKNKLIILGAVLGIIYPLIYATSTNIFQYMGGKMVFGFSGAAMGPLLFAYLQDHLSCSNNQGKLLGYLYSAQSIAGSFGAIIGGFLADKYFLGVPYFLQFIVLIIPFALALKYFNTKEEIILQKATSYSSEAKYILSNPYLIYRAILEIPFRLSWSVEVVLYPLIVFSFIQSNAITGSIFATQGIIAMLILPFAGAFVDKKSYMTGMKVSFLIMALATFFMAFSVNLLLFWFFAILFSVGLAISGPSRGVLEIKNIESEHRAEILAILTTFGYFLEAFSPFLAGILLIWLKPQMVLFVYSLITWFFLALATIILRMRLKNAYEKKAREI